MKKKAIISILSHERLSKDDAIEVVTPGDFYKKEDEYFAVYEETEISGMEGTTTTLKISKEKLSLLREGTTNAEMHFDKNKQCTTLYNTPYGVLEIKIDTDDLNIDVDDKGGEVFIRYNMIIAGQTSQNTELKIKIKS